MIRLPALPKTSNPNGDLGKPPESRRRYYCYVFTPTKSLSVKFLASVAESLAGTHPNIGDLMLKIGVKLIGQRGVQSWAVQYTDSDNTIRLIVTQDGKSWVSLGTIAPE